MLTYFESQYRSMSMSIQYISVVIELRFRCCSKLL